MDDIEIIWTIVWLLEIIGWEIIIYMVIKINLYLKYVMHFYYKSIDINKSYMKLHILVQVDFM